MDDLRKEHEPGDIVMQRLASLSWRFPHDMAQVWIVSDMTPQEIKDKKHLGLDPTHHTFVCFSEADAKKLLQNIEKNREHNSKLMATELFKLTGYHQQATNDQIISKELSGNLLHVLAPYQEALTVLADDMKDYQEQILRIRQGGMNQGVGREIQRVALASDSDHYPQFEQIYRLLDQINEVAELLQEASQTQGKVDFPAIQDKLDHLTQSLKDHISAHPYKSPEQSLPHLLLQNLSEFKKSIPQMVQAVDLPLAPVASTSSAAQILRELSPGVVPAPVAVPAEPIIQKTIEAQAPAHVEPPEPSAPSIQRRGPSGK